VQPFDLFPQTRHIENVMCFELVRHGVRTPGHGGDGGGGGSASETS